MESLKKKFVIAKKVEHTFRNFKEGDHIVFLYGMNNCVFGTWLSDSSNNYNLEQFILTIPSGFKINGIIVILNDDVYQDYDSVFEREISGIKNCIQNTVYENLVEDNLLTLVMKDVLYLDDFDSISFDKSQMSNSDGTEIEVVFSDLDEEIKSKYIFLYSKLLIDVNKDIENQKENENNILKLEFQNEEKIDSIVSGLNFYLFINKEKLLLDSVDKFGKESLEHVTKLINKLSLGTKEEKLIFTFGVKDKEGEMENLNKIKIFSSLTEKTRSDLECEFGGYLLKVQNGRIENIFSSIVNSLKVYIKYLITKRAEISERVLIEKSIFNSHPLFALIEENNKISNEETFFKKLNILTTKFISKPSTNLKETPSRITNVHTNITKDIPQYSKRFLVKGDYEYYHYGQDDFNDKGWGCAYRSLQTLFSWFLMNGFKKEGLKVPSILDIQKTLVQVGDKEAKLIGSNDWIGAFEVSIVLNELMGVDSQIIYVSSGAELTSKGRELAFHFETSGTPIMIGGGVYAYTILGVEYDRVKGDCMFLILDPHYPGEDDVKTIINKGWCQWKTSALFEKGHFYNMCLPQIPK